MYFSFLKQLKQIWNRKERLFYKFKKKNRKLRTSLTATAEKK